MLKKIIYTLALKSLAVGSICPSLYGALPLEEGSLNQNYPDTLVVNNRILLKIGGKVISIWDLVKKMDLLFYRQYPELAGVSAARCQFYMGSWRTVLDAIIDDCLIMADAEEKKIEVHDGEVREELERLFGPDVVVNLDKLDMSLDEAFDLLRTELTVQRMSAIMVRSKALVNTRPSVIKERYEEFLAQNPPYTCWVYRVLSVRGEDHERLVAEAYDLMKEKGLSFEEMAAYLGQKEGKVQLSEEFWQKESDLSSAYKAVLKNLDEGQISAPVSNQRLSRIFFLKEVQRVGVPSFSEMEEQLKQEITQLAHTRFSVEYREKLRKHYGLTEQYLNHLIPPDLRPFDMR